MNTAALILMLITTVTVTAFAVYFMILLIKHDHTK